MKNRILYGYKMILSISAVYSHDHMMFTLMITWLTGSFRLLVFPHTTYHYPTKEQNLKIKAQFLLNVYFFHIIIKSKYFKLKHCKLGTYNAYQPCSRTGISPGSVLCLLHILCLMGVCEMLLWHYSVSICLYTGALVYWSVYCNRPVTCFTEVVRRQIWKFASPHSDTMS